jgi:hypothetical protein
VLTAYALGGLILVLLGRRGLAGKPSVADVVDAAPELVPAR